MGKWFKSAFLKKAAVENGVPPLQHISKHDARLADYLLRLTEAYFSDVGSNNRTLGFDLSHVKLDGDPRFISDMMARTDPHDEDYIIFRENKDPKSIVLDIGANWGYSVGSLRSVGVKGKIVSFEAIPPYSACLRRIKELESDNYDYLMTALSSEKGSLTFVIPVVSQMALTALASASENPNIESLVKNIHHFILNWMPGIENVDLRFCRFEVQVDTLNNIILSRSDVFSGFAIDAIKVDVEGLEFEVLKGASNVLLQHHPLIMAEGGNRQDRLQEFMSSLGYLFAERRGNQMILIDGRGSAASGFFIHKSRVERYRVQGILQ
jgi:FkbM family methyltransferase